MEHGSKLRKKGVWAIPPTGKTAGSLAQLIMKKKLLVVGAVVLSGIIAAVPLSIADAKSDGPRLAEVTAFNSDKEKRLTYSVSYDKDGRVISVKAARPEDKNGGFFAQDTYTYDGSGRISEITAANLSPGKTALEYDSDGRIVRVRHPDTFKYDKTGKVTETNRVYSDVSYEDGKTVIRSGLTDQDTIYTRTYNDGLLQSEDVTTANESRGTITYKYNEDGYVSSVESTVPHYDMVAMEPVNTSRTDYSYTYDEKFGEKVPVEIKTRDYTYRLKYEEGKSVDEQQKMLLGTDTGYSGLYSITAYDESQLCGFHTYQAPKVTVGKLKEQ